MSADPRRFSAIAHEGLRLWNPLPEAATFAVVDELSLPVGARVLDVGCGRAELLVRILARTDANGVGVEPWTHAIGLAREAVVERGVAGRLELRQEPFDATAFEPHSFHAALCIGSTHAAGGLDGTLAALRRLLVAGGTAIVGEGHWQREPDPAYLASFGGTRDELTDLAGNLAAMRDAGFDVVRTLVSGVEDFDRYEERYAANVERFAERHPADPDAESFRHRIRAWRQAYLRWGRDTMGFALYVLR